MSLSTQPNALSPCEVLNAKDPIAKLVEIQGMTWMNHIYAVPKNGVPYEKNELSYMSNMSL